MKNENNGNNHQRNEHQSGNQRKQRKSVIGIGINGESEKPISV